LTLTLREIVTIVSTKKQRLKGSMSRRQTRQATTRDGVGLAAPHGLTSLTLTSGNGGPSNLPLTSIRY